MLNEKTYNILKWVAIIFIPALCTALFAIGQIWDVENIGKIVGTLVALNTLLGVSIGVSTATYNASDAKYDGVIDPMTANAQTSENALRLRGDEYDVANQKSVLLKVQEDPQVPEF